MPTITIDGTEHEVALDAITFENGHRVITDKEISDAYVSKSLIEGDDPQYVHKNVISKRFKDWLPREKAVEDEQIVAAIIKEHGEAFKAGDLEEAKKQWDRAEADPLRSQLKSAEENLTTFELQVVGSAIDADAVKVWKDEFATAPDGRKSWAAVNFTDEFRYDRDHGYVVAVGKSGDPLPSSKPTQRRPYMSVGERFRMLAEEDAWRPYARPPERNTTGGGANPQGSTLSGVAKNRSKMSDAEKAAYIVEHGQDAYFALPQ